MTQMQVNRFKTNAKRKALEDFIDAMKSILEKSDLYEALARSKFHELRMCLEQKLRDADEVACEKKRAIMKEIVRDSMASVDKQCTRQLEACRSIRDKAITGSYEIYFEELLCIDSLEDDPVDIHVFRSSLSTRLMPSLLRRPQTRRGH